MKAALKIEALSKRFGKNQVIDNLDLSIPEHSIFGFIGPNGSGKTTTMKMILGLIKPDNGSITVFGERVSYGETKTNRHIGYLPDVPEFYGYMRPLEYLHLCGRITGMSRAQIIQRSSELLELVGLTDTKRKIAGYSRGMKQRLGIAQALLNAPSLLICDEPTSALDPVGRIEILEILSRVRGETTVIFSTHVLTEPGPQSRTLPPRRRDARSFPEARLGVVSVTFPDSGDPPGLAPLSQDRFSTSRELLY